MRNPIIYAMHLEKIAEDIGYDAAVEHEMYGPEDEHYQELLALYKKVRALAERWRQYAFAGGPLMLDTWQLLGVEIDEWPWVKPRHPAMKSFHENMLHNDVT